MQADLFMELRAGLQPRGTAPLVRLAMTDNAFFTVDYVQRAAGVAQRGPCS